MFNGLDLDKLLLIGIVAILVIGPERLPAYAAKLAQFTRRAREWLSGAKTRMKDELGEDFDDVEWRKLDPRQYDPRRIIREALLDDAPVPTAAAPAAATTAAAATAAPAPATAPAAPSAVAVAFDPSRDVPFDNEAT
ncbi:Sec-independent protein translocase TatB [Microbacterium sp.]|uniref:Sec-independent protein translocase TatB n=1 Tax=Microbacterium sp. TaxID=51671 RepID=UPI0039E678FB